VNEHEERILDAYLEEVLGGRYPPDLSARILQTWEARQTGPSVAESAELPVAGLAAVPQPEDMPVAPPVLASAVAMEPEPPPIQDQTALPRPFLRVSRARRVGWWWYAAAASIALAVASTAVVLVVLHRSRSGGMLAHTEPSAAAPDEGLLVQPAETAAVSPTDRSPRVVATAPPRRSTPSATGAGSPRPTRDPPPRAIETPAPKVVAPRIKPQPVSDREITALVSRTLRREWDEHGVAAAPAATDETWCRRVYARLTGREPTAKELERFVRNKGADKRQQLVDELLASEEYARHWARLWTNALLGPSPQTNDLANREELDRYLAGELHADRSYGEIASALLSATGTSRAGADDYRPEVCFLMAGAADGAAGATDRVSRVLLGRQLICARCHDHSSWRQSDYWELSAFFRQMKVRRDPQTQATRLVDVDFYGETGVAKDAEIFYPGAGGGLRMAYPALDGHRLPHSGLVSDVNRRQELAKLVVASPDFARAAVNRVWSVLLGYGFTQPVDDMGAHNPPAFPELLEGLADQFTAHDYHLAGLIRWIVLSEPFGLSSKGMPESWIDAPETGGQPLFARYYAGDDRPRDIYKALVACVQTRPVMSATASRGIAARLSSVSLSPRVPPLLETQPADMAPGARWLQRLGAAHSLRPEQKIEHVFLSVLSRRPTDREMVAAKLLLADRLDDTVGLQELRRTLLACYNPLLGPRGK
jgi:hypothetical protein